MPAPNQVIRLGAPSLIMAKRKRRMGNMDRNHKLIRSTGHVNVCVYILACVPMRGDELHRGLMEGGWERVHWLRSFPARRGEPLPGRLVH